MKKFLVLLFGICLLTTGCFGAKQEKETKEEKITKPEKISYSELEKIVNNYTDYVDIDVIDIRTEEEYKEGHVIGAINIPYVNLDEIIISHEREIIVYGTNSAKSKQAANDLINLGYTKVKYIAGISNWPYDLEEY